MSPEGNCPFHPCRLAEQSLLLLDRQVVYNLIFCRLIFNSLSNSWKINPWCPEDRWVASGGDNMVCSCCATSCDQQGRRKRQTAAFAQQVALEGTASLGPITLEESVLEVELPSKQAPLRQTQETSPAGEATRLTSKLKLKPLWSQLYAANGTTATYLLSLLLVYGPSVRRGSGDIYSHRCLVMPQNTKNCWPWHSHLIWCNKSISEWVSSLFSLFLEVRVQCVKFGKNFILVKP